MQFSSPAQSSKSLVPRNSFSLLPLPRRFFLPRLCAVNASFLRAPLRFRLLLLQQGQLLVLVVQVREAATLG